MKPYHDLNQRMCGTFGLALAALIFAARLASAVPSFGNICLLVFCHLRWLQASMVLTDGELFAIK